MKRSFDAATSRSSDIAGIGQHCPYSDYKDSEVEWIGDIPTHWSIKAARREFSIQLGKMLQSTESGLQDSQTPYFKAQHVQWEFVRTTDLPTMYADPIDQAHYGVVDGDLLVCEGGDVGRAGIVRSPPPGAIIQNALHRVRSKGTSDIRFLLYLLKYAASQDWFDVLCNRATIAHFTSDKLGDLMIPLAPLSEQRAIAGFLDEETARIDALVAKKERLIELIKDKRSALITRTVTKGLNLNVPMKESGVEWLAEIPAHWCVKRLWHVTPADRRIIYGIVLPGPHVANGVPIVKGGDVSRERLRVDVLSRTSRAIEARYARSRLRGGDLVYAIRGSIGEVEMVPIELQGANLTQDAARVAYTDQIHGPWLHHALKSAAIFSQLESGALGATIRGINIRDLRRAVIPVPPYMEQHAIADFLCGEIETLDALTSYVSQAIDRLKELRAALISAAVTGKIDVRETAA